MRVGRGSDVSIRVLVPAAAVTAAPARIDQQEYDDSDHGKRDRAQHKPAGAAPGTQSALSMLFVKSGHVRNTSSSL